MKMGIEGIRIQREVWSRAKVLLNLGNLTERRGSTSKDSKLISNFSGDEGSGYM